ncbi:DUF397 domain-containing protein [Streptomyces sp. NPDC016845]|uniref:DUF397 domain-containing protein n=1 Tax=Streptomyces sp. NPDC016845 TaxID=3364972 RepID=UPI00378CA45C
MSTPTQWQKSSFSGGGIGNDCVELASLDGAIRIRESNEPGIELITGHAPLQNLIRTLKAQRREG